MHFLGQSIDSQKKLGIVEFWFQMNEWNFLETRSSTMNRSRGLAYGYMWNRKGELVASLVQETLARVKL